MSWHTKEDVLGDLAEVMGNGIKEFDDQYILHGEQPPPPACTSNEVEDDEWYLRLHGEPGDRTIKDDDCKGPDLSGITKMLRMVDKFHSTSEVEIEKSTTENSSMPVLTITKLNVYIPEFVPKDCINNENTNSERLCAAQSMDKAKIKQISDKLKSRITTSSKSENMKIKRERNLAIASLLKLHSKENSVADETTTKLMTPEQFQKNRSKMLNDKSSQISQKELTSTRPLLQVESVKSPVEITEEVNSRNQELEESMAKVNSWLNKGCDKQQLETRSPALYLGPVTFKKKEIKKPKTPYSEVSDKSTKRMVDKSYVPSENADKLRQSYMDRVKAKEDKTLDMWGKLERDLKVKDEKILAQRHLSSEETSQKSSNGSQS